LRKTWKERYFVLTISTGEMLYYKPATPGSWGLLGNIGENVAKGVITLRYPGSNNRALSPVTVRR
jgi:hypothetical protein